MDTTPKQSLALPIAIIIAGIAIGIGIYFAGGTKSSTTNLIQNDTTTPTNGDIVMNPVSQADHILGNPNAPIIVVEYSDLECPFCKVFHETMHKIVDLYGKEGSVAWVYRQMPLEQLHAKAYNESLAAECAGGIGGNDMFWKYTDKIFSITPSNDRLEASQLEVVATQLGINTVAFRDCMTKQTYKARVDAQYQDGFVATGGRPGTPFNVIVLRKPIDSAIRTKLSSAFSQAGDILRYSNDGTKIAISGALPYDAFKFLIDTLLGK